MMLMTDVFIPQGTRRAWKQAHLIQNHVSRFSFSFVVKQKQEVQSEPALQKGELKPDFMSLFHILHHYSSRLYIDL